MERSEFIKTLTAASAVGSLSRFNQFTDTLPRQSRKMPVLFTSHGSPFDIPVSREDQPFWKALHELGKSVQEKYEIKAALVISAHWCTSGTFVNSSSEQQQLFDYYGFPAKYYQARYQAKGAPEVANEVNKLVPSVATTTDWGLDHGAWPMLMHLFPEATIPVFQMSIDYYASPAYHFNLATQLKSLREKGVLIIGSGSVIHNLQLAGQKLRNHDMTPFSWQADYDAWIKAQIDTRNVTQIINYETSHKLGKLASPTPDHFVPILYSLGLQDTKDEITHFYEDSLTLPAFSERSFIIGDA